MSKDLKEALEKLIQEEATGLILEIDPSALGNPGEAAAAREAAEERARRAGYRPISQADRDMAEFSDPDTRADFTEVYGLNVERYAEETYELLTAGQCAEGMTVTLDKTDPNNCLEWKSMQDLGLCGDNNEFVRPWYSVLKKMFKDDENTGNKKLLKVKVGWWHAARGFEPNETGITMRLRPRPAFVKGRPTERSGMPLGQDYIVAGAVPSEEREPICTRPREGEALETYNNFLAQYQERLEGRNPQDLKFDCNKWKTQCLEKDYALPALKAAGTGVHELVKQISEVSIYELNPVFGWMGSLNANSSMALQTGKVLGGMAFTDFRDNLALTKAMMGVEKDAPIFRKLFGPFASFTGAEVGGTGRLGKIGTRGRGGADVSKLGKPGQLAKPEMSRILNQVPKSERVKVAKIISNALSGIGPVAAPENKRVARAVKIINDIIDQGYLIRNPAGEFYQRVSAVDLFNPRSFGGASIQGLISGKQQWVIKIHFNPKLPPVALLNVGPKMWVPIAGSAYTGTGIVESVTGGSSIMGHRSAMIGYPSYGKGSRHPFWPLIRWMFDNADFIESLKSDSLKIKSLTFGNHPDSLGKFNKWLGTAHRAEWLIFWREHMALVEGSEKYKSWYLKMAASFNKMKDKTKAAFWRKEYQKLARIGVTEGRNMASVLEVTTSPPPIFYPEGGVATMKQNGSLYRLVDATASEIAKLTESQQKVMTEMKTANEIIADDLKKILADLKSGRLDNEFVRKRLEILRKRLTEMKKGEWRGGGTKFSIDAVENIMTRVEEIYILAGKGAYSRTKHEALGRALINIFEDTPGLGAGALAHGEAQKAGLSKTAAGRAGTVLTKSVLNTLIGLGLVLDYSKALDEKEPGTNRYKYDAVGALAVTLAMFIDLSGFTRGLYLPSERQPSTYWCWTLGDWTDDPKCKYSNIDLQAAGRAFKMAGEIKETIGERGDWPEARIPWDPDARPGEWYNIFDDRRWDVAPGQKENIKGQYVYFEDYECEKKYWDSQNQKCIKDPGQRRKIDKAFEESRPKGLDAGKGKYVSTLMEFGAMHSVSATKKSRMGMRSKTYENYVSALKAQGIDIRHVETLSRGEKNRKAKEAEKLQQTLLLKYWDTRIPLPVYTHSQEKKGPFSQVKFDRVVRDMKALEGRYPDLLKFAMPREGAINNLRFKPRTQLRLDVRGWDAYPGHEAGGREVPGVIVKYKSRQGKRAAGVEGEEARPSFSEAVWAKYLKLLDEKRKLNQDLVDWHRSKQYWKHGRRKRAKTMEQVLAQTYAQTRHPGQDGLDLVMSSHREDLRIYKKLCSMLLMQGSSVATEKNKLLADLKDKTDYALIESMPGVSAFGAEMIVRNAVSILISYTQLIEIYEESRSMDPEEPIGPGQEGYTPAEDIDIYSAPTPGATPAPLDPAQAEFEKQFQDIKSWAADPAFDQPAEVEEEEPEKPAPPAQATKSKPRRSSRRARRGDAGPKKSKKAKIKRKKPSWVK